MLIKSHSLLKFQSLEYTPTIEFKAKWEFWQKECLSILRNEDFKEAEELEIICNVNTFFFLIKMLLILFKKQIFCGNEMTFTQCKDYFGCWYYMIISWFSFSNPTFNISDLHMQLSSKVIFFSLTIYIEFKVFLFFKEIYKFISKRSEIT